MSRLAAPHCLIPAAIAAVIAAPALAQTFDARVAFRNDHAASTTPTGNVITIDAPRVYDLQVLVGAFDSQGFTNRGMLGYQAQIHLHDPTGTSVMAPRPGGGRRAPYNWLVGDGSIGNPITVDALRNPRVRVPWLEGEPYPAMPPPLQPFDPDDPTSGGVPDEFFPAYRFVLNIQDLTPRTITLTVEGNLSSIESWVSTGFMTPGPNGPGWAEFIAGVLRTQDFSPTVLTLYIVPAPSSAGAISIAGLAVARRRRRRC